MERKSWIISVTVLLLAVIVTFSVVGYQNRDAIDFEAQYTRTSSGPSGLDSPVVTIIRSVEALNTYYEENKDIYRLGHAESLYDNSTIGFLDACEKYDNAYFENKILVLVVPLAGSSSVRNEVSNIKLCTFENRKELKIEVDSRAPEEQHGDLDWWHIFVELEKEADVGDTENIKFVWNYKVKRGYY